MKGLKVLIKILLMLLVLLYSQGYSQGSQEQVDRLIGEDELETKYYKTFIENFYKEDDLLSEIDPETNRSFYIVKYNKQGKLHSVAYYTVEGEVVGRRRVKQTQNVNKDKLAYYSINYRYNEQSQIVKKEFKDENNKLLSYYKYIWDERAGKVRKLEKWIKTKFLGKMQMNGVNRYKWEGDNIKVFTYYENYVPVERFHFSRNPNTGENQEEIYLIGNNKISLFVLTRYERFNPEKKNERTFYIEYEQIEDKVYTRKYNHDRVLIEEYPPIDTSKSESVQAGGRDNKRGGVN